MKLNTTNEKTLTETKGNLLSPDPTNNVLDFSTTLKELRKTVDANLVRRRAGGRDRNGNVHMVEYVEWHTVADVLDDKATNWAHTVKDIRSIGDIVTITVAITIDGVTREGIGTGKAFSETGIKKAEHDALKRAADGTHGSAWLICNRQPLTGNFLTFFAQVAIMPRMESG